MNRNISAIITTLKKDQPEGDLNRKIYMNFSDFSSEEQALLSSMPYRVGAWLSKADLQGGEESSKRETEALRYLIYLIAGNFCESVFVMELMEETIARSNIWSIWGENTDDLLSDARRSVEMVEEKLNPEDLISYKASMMEIALGVARAYGEALDNSSAGKKLNLYAKLWFDRVVSQVKGVHGPGEFEASLNISENEHKALLKLAEALKADAKEMSGKYQGMNH